MLSDVIAAIATVPGRSALAVLRVSGPGAFDVVARVLHPFQPDPPRAARRTQVRGTGAEDALGDALYVAYHAPASFTGEPLVEISTYGGLLVPAEALAALLRAGARQAAPGEFTRRALQHGKLDLLQAEAIDDLIGATTTAQRRTAVHQLDRGLSGRIDGLRAAVLELEALVSYEIDFPEEDDGPVPESRLRRAVERVTTDMAALLETAAEGERLREGALAVVAGRPNAGKSSLFNALLGSERAIVTDVPGTTRDAIEAGVSCGGYPFRLVDTAGLRTSDDAVERLGIEVSRRFLEAADVVVLCAEAGRPLTAAERDFLRDATAPVVLVRTKADLCAGDADDLAVSAHTGAGLAELRDRLAATAFAAMTARADLTPAVTRARHRVALTRALGEVRAFADARTAGVDTIAAATHLRSAVLHLEDLIGVVGTEEVLDRVFADFCIGK